MSLDRETRLSSVFSQVKKKVLVSCMLVSNGNAGITLVVRSCLSMEWMSTTTTITMCSLLGLQLWMSPTTTITMWPLLGQRKCFLFLPRTVEQLCMKPPKEATTALLICCCGTELNLGQPTGEPSVKRVIFLLLGKPHVDCTGTGRITCSPDRISCSPLFCSLL